MGRAFLASAQRVQRCRTVMGAGVVEKGDGNVRGVGDSSGGHSGVGCTKEMGRFLGWRARGVTGCCVEHRLERSTAGRQDP